MGSKSVVADKASMEKLLRRVEEIYWHRGVTTREKNFIWQAMASFCFYQLDQARGPFYRIAKHLLTPAAEPGGKYRQRDVSKRKRRHTGVG